MYCVQVFWGSAHAGDFLRSVKGHHQNRRAILCLSGSDMLRCYHLDPAHCVFEIASILHNAEADSDA